MHWRRGGLIFQPDGQLEWMHSHATMPVPFAAEQGRLDLYFSTRDADNHSYPARLSVDADDPSRVLDLSGEPLLRLGPPGTFDDSGIMVSSVLAYADALYLFYVGWNQGVSVSYRLAIGLAVSTDGGRSFEKFADGPILDRAVDEPYFCTTPHVIREQGRWRMWYSSCTEWRSIAGRREPLYLIRYAESTDGIQWTRRPQACIGYDANTDAIARPYVISLDGRYSMFYSARAALDYRTDPTQGYRLGFAESADGICWEKREEAAGLTRATTGWDSEMIAYPAYIQTANATYLFYNGNGFGRSGLGFCILADPGESC